MVTTFRIIKATSAVLLTATSLGCSGTQNGGTQDIACVENTRVLFEPKLEEKGEHTIVVTYNDTTVTCAFEIDDYVTPFDRPCGSEPVVLMVPSDVEDDSPTLGPEDTLPIVKGVVLQNTVDEVTVEVDGTSYGTLTTKYVDATEDSCAHNAATVQLD